MKTIGGRFMAMTIGLLGIMGCAGERPQNLGTRDGLLTTCPSSPNCVSSQAADGSHRIAPLAFSGDPDVALALLRLVLQQRGDTTIVEEKPEYLRVELRTTLFIDDAEFLLDRKLSVIHIRSASRLGYSDLGKNRRRAEEIRSQIQAEEAKR